MQDAIQKSKQTSPESEQADSVAAESSGSETLSRRSFAGNLGNYFKSLAEKRKRRKKEKSDDPYIYPMF